MKAIYLSFTALLMFLYLFGTVIGATKLSLAVELGYITFMASRGAISQATAYDVWLTIYLLVAVGLLFLAFVTHSRNRAHGEEEA